jgi:branched-chain amino acid aminotransferase
MRPFFYVKDNEFVPQSQPYQKFTFNGPVIYEVIRIIEGKILFFEDHLERFRNSLQKSQLDTFPLSDENIFERVKGLIRTNKLGNGNVKFLLNKNLQGTVSFYAHEIPYYYPSEIEYQQGIKLILFEAERTNPSIKQLHSNLKERVDAEIKENKAFEALLVHPGGYITEGSKSNFFIIKNSRVYTTPAEDVLPGVTRKKLLNLFQRYGITCIEARILPKDLHTFEAAFISGTSPKVLPVKTIDQFIYSPNHPLLLQIMHLYNTEIADYLKKSAKIL